MRGMVDHVFFDLDRTLWDFDRNSKETLQELFVEFKLDGKLKVSEQEFRSEYERINEHYWHLFRNGEVNRSQLRLGRFEDALAHFGHPDNKLAFALGEAYVSISPRKTSLVDGALELLDHLKERYSLHIITNGFEEVQHIKLSASGIASYFHEVITSERAGVRKPHVEIYRFAERLTSSTPERCVMIGDHFEADVKGAHAAGWHAIHLNADGDQTGEHIEVRSLNEVRQLL
jgi:putative hydrolase of the HAD superfamily